MYATHQSEQSVNLILELAKIIHPPPLRRDRKRLAQRLVFDLDRAPLVAKGAGVVAKADIGDRRLCKMAAVCGCSLPMVRSESVSARPNCLLASAVLPSQSSAIRDRCSKWPGRGFQARAHVPEPLGPPRATRALYLIAHSQAPASRGSYALSALLDVAAPTAASNVATA